MQHRRHAHAIIADARTIEHIPLAFNHQGRRSRKNRIGVRQKHQERATLRAAASPDIDIAHGINLRGITALPPQRSHQACSLKFLAGRRRYLADTPRQIGDCLDMGLRRRSQPFQGYRGQCHRSLFLSLDRIIYSI